MQHNHFKENHEGLAAREFLPRYNKLYSTNFDLIDKKQNIAPDFHSRDKKTGEALNFDVTLGATRQMIDEWRKLLRKGRDDQGARRCFNLNTEEDLNVCKNSIINKLSMRYGKNCALVLYHFNLCLPAEGFVNNLRTSIDLVHSPFDRGIWLLSSAEFYRIDETLS